MAVNGFGVTQQTVAAFHFPMWPSFSAASKPTAATVTLMISEASGSLAGKLYSENIVASAITDTASSEYLMCAEQLRRMVALKVLKASTQQDPDLAKALQTEIDLWFTQLSRDGGTFLGNSALQTGTSDPDGPTWHASVFGLTQDDPGDMSDVVPLLRKSDQL